MPATSEEVNTLAQAAHSCKAQRLRRIVGVPYGMPSCSGAGEL